MALTLIGSSNFVESSGTAPGAITPHASTATGDLLIFTHYTNADTGTETVTSPTDFTDIFNAMSTNFGLICVAWKFRADGETTYTASITNHLSGASGDCLMEHIHTWRGADPTTPIGSVTAANSTWASSNNIGPISPPASASVAPGNVLAVYGGRRENVTGFTTLTGDNLNWTLYPGLFENTGQGRDAGSVIQWGYNDSGSAQTATSKTTTTTGTAQAGAGRQFIINAAAAAVELPSLVMARHR